MRTLVALTFLFTSIISNGQKSYQIEKVLLLYTQPKNYKPRVDNFISAIKAGDSLAKKNSKLQNQSNDDNILFSFEKSDSSKINIIFADYKNNSNIAKYTLKGYVDKLVEFMKLNYAKIGSDIIMKTREVFIDKIKFFVVESKIFHKDKNYTYWTSMYIAELSNKEFNISIVYDNEKDKKVIEESILKSRFITK
jgi:hypothetical protein